MEQNQGPLPFQVVKGRTPEELTRELAEAAAFGYVPMAGGMINRNGEVWVITVLEDEMGHHDSVEQRFEEEVRAAERRAEQEIEEARRRADAIRGGERIAPRPERVSATAVTRPVPGRVPEALPGTVPQVPPPLRREENVVPPPLPGPHG